ncbi:MAG: CbiX/SirB N-terminal domain-containing protein [Bryobacteraceae bacterium]
MTTGIIVFAHGSRLEPANEAVRSVARQLVGAGRFETVEAAFLELGEPSLEGAVEALVGRGVHDILVVPYFLTLGIHLERDLPNIINQLASRIGHVRIRVAAPLDGHPALVEALLDRIKAGIAT